MKITKKRLKQIIKEELEAVNVEEAVEMPVIGQGGQDLTDSDVQFAINFIKNQLSDMDQELEDIQNSVPSQLNQLDDKVEDLADVSVMNRDKIKTLKYVLQQMIRKHNLREELNEVGEDPDALSRLAGDNSFLARLARLEDLLQQQLESGEITRQEYDDTMKITAAAKKRTIMKALGQMKEASGELDNFNEGKLTDIEKAYKKIPDKHLNKAGDDKKDAIQHK